MILHSESFGKGEPIVFLHSGLQTGLTDFEYQRDYFKEQFQVIVPDLRGHGNSVSTDLSDIFEGNAKDLAETLERMGIGSAHIVGASLGALVAIVFAKRFPDKVRSLTISGVMAEQPDNWAQLREQEARNQQQIFQYEETNAYFDQLHKGDWRKLIEMGQNEDWYPFEETKDLSAIAAPILYIAGEGNPSETKGVLYYPAKQDNVHVSAIPFASHLVHAEQAELHAKTLELFLSHVD
ncbi:alpha/beta fold hydrolase [Planococcus sp. SSTMD024]|uniref:alpha/beta fold hydrolase n=1 Tax=Planococcus sp. SSTMD024 TaxID=3242163 RepID=UPI00351EF3D0